MFIVYVRNFPLSCDRSMSRRARIWECAPESWGSAASTWWSRARPAASSRARRAGTRGAAPAANHRWARGHVTRAPPITAHLEAAGGQVEVGGGRGVAGLQPHHQRGGGRVEYGGGGHLGSGPLSSLLYNPQRKYRGNYR